MGHKSVNDIAMCIFLYTPVTVREHLICREHFLSAMSYRKYLDHFWVQNIFGYFWTTFLVSIGLRIGQNFRNAQILRHCLVRP